MKGLTGKVQGRRAPTDEERKLVRDTERICNGSASDNFVWKKCGQLGREMFTKFQG